MIGDKAMLALLAVVVAVLLGLALAGAKATSPAPPQLDVPDIPLGGAGSRVPANVLVNLSLTFEDAAAAYRGEYDGAVEYAGYFNPRLCYSYPMKARADGRKEPDPGEASGYFSPSGPADTRRECKGAFSGNFMNWATASTLDLLRYALTGGDRVIDDAGLTVLQRAWLPDGSTGHPDFYANPDYFPRKMVSGEAGARLTPFSGAALYVVSCRNRVLFSTANKGDSCDGPLAADKQHGQFNVRVAVCGAGDSGLRPDLCRPYGQSFKPEGSLQRAGELARVGLMSYLTEHGAGDRALYGGVLRAPLKFLGPTLAAPPQFGMRPNAQAEWNAATGILTANPDGGAGALSGAINYLNRLGRTSDAQRGRYKSADPGAELFYEALRYLQGSEASVPAPASDDAFPVWQSRADPLLAACQRNVIATVGHSAFVGDRFVPGNTRTEHDDKARAADAFAPGDAFDVMQATRRVGDMEADAAGAFGNGAPQSGLAGLERRGDGPGGAGSTYLAGAAYWANTHAVRRDHPVTVGSMALELGAGKKAQGSVLYLAAKYGGFEDGNGDGNPFMSSGGRDDSEWRGAGGAPRHYHAAADPHALIGAARGLLEGAAGRAGIAAGPATASPIRKGKGYLIQTAYDPSSWSGSVQRRAVSVDAGGKVAVAPEPDWEAAVLLGEPPLGTPPPPKALAPAARKIYTLAYGADGASATIAFQWSALPPAQRAWLDAPGPGMAADGLGEARTAYFRGERSHEAGQGGALFRRRAHLLGDVIRSVPLLAGAPSAAVQGPGYPEFYRRHQARRHAVFVSANDGMLHAFDSGDGTELFAYVPHALLPSLSVLSSPGYRHRAFADGSAASGEAFIGGRWRSVLASGMGMGARGVFALDISDPAAFEQGMGALWEFTDKDDPLMGHVTAPPLIVKLRTGTDKERAQYRYFVMVSSGINNGSADGALFLLALDKPPAQAWQRGSNYYRLVAAGADASLSNALAPPALALAGDGSVRLAYAGDLQGTLWRFDLSGSPPWSAAPRILFTAIDPEGRRQPLTHAPRAVFAPGGGYMVLFGTGKFIETADLHSPGFSPQSFYALRDAGPEGRATGASASGNRPSGNRPSGAAALTRADLAQRRLSGIARLAVTGEPYDPGAPDAKAGWYFDFPGSRSAGERMAGSPMAVGAAIVFDSLLPGADPCAAAATRTYVLDALSGLAIDTDHVARDGAHTGTLIPGIAAAPPLIMAAGTDVQAGTATGGAVATRHLAIVRAGAAAAQPIRVRFLARRLSWREVANWQDLHDAATR